MPGIRLLRRIDFLLMQIIRAVQVSVGRYVSTSFHQSIRPPVKCPHCNTPDALAAHGYYSRNVTNPERGVLRIFVRRFRCRICRRTVSILPSFAQPYRLIVNATINEFFGGTLGTNALSWLPLLKQYWNRFANWLPEIERIIRSVVERSPPQPDAAGWWAVMVSAFGDLEKITTTLASRFGVTLFGRYRCHSITPLHTTYSFS
jgi:transposase-like protein